MSRSKRDILDTEKMLERLTEALAAHYVCQSGNVNVRDMPATLVARADAQALRRISMTLHTWYELECGSGDDHASWCVTRGERLPKVNGKENFRHDDNGKPYLERHPYNGMVSYSPIPDREAGAVKRLKKIMSRYPTLGYYIQGDPRGCALYILRPGDVPEGEQANAYYSRGLAVFK